MPQALQPKKNRPWYKSPYTWVIVVVASGVSFGWGRLTAPPPLLRPTQPLRLSGYSMISPLLACGFSAQNAQTSPLGQNMNNVIENVINEHIQAGDISKASTFFADYSRDYAVNTNGNEEYYPSSLGKIPIMMAYFALAEQDRSVLDKVITFPAGSPDLNDTQDIQPLEAIVPGHNYTVNDLIGYMIKYSDNNATQLLYENIDQNDLNNVYKDLGIPINYDPSITNLDFITPEQISILFRILYNATYLSSEDSQAALQLLSESSFTQGLVAGVPSSTVVAHKLGLVGIQSGGITTEHELHDCGIVYAPNHTYLLCVMTRGASPLSNMEATIADISRAVYQQVEGN